MPIDAQTFESYRPLLFAIAYRMIGSAMEAEDMVQETYLRCEHAHDIQSAKAFLTTIVTRLCIDYWKSARAQREDYKGIWLPEPLLTGESASAVHERDESISMAFLVLLEKLSPVERAVYLLRDVFDFRYAEIAPMVDKSEANCRRYYRNARQQLVEQRPQFEAISNDHTKLVEGFLNALTAGDVEGLTRLVAADAVLYGDGGGKAPAIRKPLHGREAVAPFLHSVYRMLPADTRAEIAEVNGTPSILFWGSDTLYFVMHVTIAHYQIAAIRNVLNPDKLVFIRQQCQNDATIGAPDSL